MSATSEGKAPYLGIVSIILLTLIVYLPGIGVYFVADDFQYLEVIERLRQPGDIVPYLTGGSSRVGWPVVVLLFWLGRMVAGLDPTFYRILAVIIHLANTLLVFLLVRRILGTGSGVPATVAAMVFALHPRQHESIMWLSSLTWTMGTLWSLLATVVYVTWRQTGRTWWMLAALAACAWAVFSNPGAVVLPVLLIAYDVTHRQQGAPPFLVWTGLSMITIAMAFASGVLSLPSGQGRASYGLSLLDGLTHLPVFLTYLWWPVPLDLKSLFAAFPLGAVLIIGVSLAVAALGGLAILRHGTPLARWGIVWALTSLVPPSLFSTFIADRYMSLMLAGVALVCAGLVAALHILKGLTRARAGLFSSGGSVALAVTVIWGALALSQVMIKVGDWRLAGRITATVRDETLKRYPEVPDGARFFYIGLPDMVNRCVVWSHGIDSAVRVWYNNPTLDARRPLQDGRRTIPTAEDLVLDFSSRW